MRKTVKYLLVIALALLVLALALCWRNWRLSAGDRTLARWGHSALAVSEEAYYADRIDEIIRAWIEMGQRAEHEQQGRPRQPYNTFLVLDFDRHGLWIEERGQVLQECHGELPARMTWAVHYDDGNGVKLLGNLVRLKYWGFDLSRRFPEAVWLVGQRAKESVAWDLTGRSSGIRHGRDAGPFQLPSPPRRERENAQYYDSLLISDAQYDQARLSWTDTGEEPTSARSQPVASIEEDKAAWRNVRKKLYRAIEGQVDRTGFNLSRLRVHPGPDYSGAHAELQVATKRIAAVLRRRGTSFSAFLLIDHLGNDVWYAKVVPDPRLPAPPPIGPNPVEELPLEFLVSADQAIRSSARHAWLEKGRARQKSADSQSRWTATLPNGVVVTLLGVCTHPSAGRQWWGPDGSPLDNVLYAPFQSPPPFRNRGVRNERFFELAWRWEPPGGFQSMGVGSHFEGGSSYSSSFCRDRSGAVLHNGYHEIYTCGGSQTTFTVEAEVDKQGSCAVHFKNISLVPGENQGFEIEIVK